MQLNKKALGLTAAVLSGAFWLVTMVVSLLTGVGELTLTTIGSFHPFFEYSWVGMVVIVVEHLICGFILGWLFAWVYNKFLSRPAV